MYQCPNCGGDDLKVNAIEHVTVYINREGDVTDTRGGDIEFEGPYICLDCETIGEDFWVEEEEG